jgi:hypothetical protein
MSVESYYSTNALDWWPSAEKRGFTYQDLFDPRSELLQIPEDGVYVLAAQRRAGREGGPFVYPLSRSSIYYIGCTTVGQPRLRDHRKWSLLARDEYQQHKRFLKPRHQRYHYAARFGARLFWIRAIGDETARSLEGNLLRAFAQHFGALPVANGQRSNL